MPMRVVHFLARATSLTVTFFLACLLVACTPPDAPPAVPSDALSDTSPDTATTSDLSTSATQSQPNFLIIVADDMAYTDIGAFGGEIQTPNLDRLASQGLLFTNFHSAPTCAPARSMLLSGTDNHTAGVGSMFGANMLSGVADRVGYEGYLHPRVATLPEMLADAGYHTYMAGKWHLGSEPDQLPGKRGFERSFSLVPGSGDHFLPPANAYEEDGAILESLPADFYSTRTYTDKLIEYLAQDADDGRPFFVYAAYTSPHWPLQVPEDFLDRYAGKYDEGYDILRAQRLERARELGVIPTTDSPLPERVGSSWDELDASARRAYSRKMEIYAAMVENLDHNVGRLIEHIEGTGQLDNTVVLFMSDNGADSDEMELNPIFVARYGGADNSLANIGRPGSWVSYGPGWAHAGTAPFRWFKGFTTEGGTRVPAFVFDGRGDSVLGTDNQYLRVMDVTPTLLALAGVDEPQREFHGREVEPIVGRSFAPALSGDGTPIYGPDEPIAMELHGHRSLQRGPFKVVWEQAPGNTWWGYPIPPQWHQWQLYNIESDPSEMRDLSDERADLVAELVGLWDQYAEVNNVATEVEIVNFERWHPSGSE